MLLLESIFSVIYNNWDYGASWDYSCWKTSESKFTSPHFGRYVYFALLAVLSARPVPQISFPVTQTWCMCAGQAGKHVLLETVCQRFTWSQKSSDDQEPTCHARDKVCPILLSASALTCPAAYLEISWRALPTRPAEVVEEDRVTFQSHYVAHVHLGGVYNADESGPGSGSLCGKRWSFSASLRTWVILCHSDLTFG